MTKAARSSDALLALTVLTLAYLIAYCDRVIVMILVGQFKRDLGFTDSQIALLIGFSFAVFYAVACLPLGRLADRVNRRNLIMAGIVSWSAATAACGLFTEFTGLFIARVCVGVGEACLLPAALSMLADLFGPRTRSKAIAMFICGAPLGSGLAYLLGGSLLHRVETGTISPLMTFTEFPWQSIFAVLGLLGLLIAAALMLVDEPRRQFDARAANDRVEGQSLIGLLRGNGALIVGIVLGPSIISMAFYALLSWGPTMMVRRFDWTAQDIALWFTPLGVASGLAGPWIGALTGSFLVRTWKRSDGLMLGAVCLAIAACPLALTAVTITSAGMAVILMFTATSILIAAQTLPQIAIQYVIPGDSRGQFTAMFVFGTNVIGFGLGPSIVAALTDHVFHEGGNLHISLAIVCISAVTIGALVTLTRLSAYRLQAAMLAPEQRN